MRMKLVTAFFKGRLAARNAIRRFVSEERGASDMVAVILLIVIVIACAVIFRQYLIDAVQTIMERLAEFIGE